MTKGRPDILLYKVNLFVVLALCIAVAVLYWVVWTQQLTLNLGFHIVGFRAQNYLGIDFAVHLANGFERILIRVLMFWVPLVAASSAFFITHEYDVLWWLRRKPTSIRLRAYSFFLLAFGSFALFYLSSTFTLSILDLFVLTDDHDRFYAVTILTTVFFSVVSSFMLLGLIGFFNTLEKSKAERMRKK